MTESMFVRLVKSVTGIRFHRDGVQEEQDTVQAFGGVRGQPVATLSAVSYDYKTGRVIAASVPTVGSVGGANALWLEAYDSTQGYAWADGPQAERSLRLKQQALEARHKRWIGRSVVRSFEVGTTLLRCLSGGDHRRRCGRPTTMHGRNVFSRKIVGWAFGQRQTADLVLAALNMALQTRRPEGVIHHSDRGSQYTSLEFGKCCSVMGIRPSMGSVGGAYDNAMAEGFSIGQKSPINFEKDQIAKAIWGKSNFNMPDIRELVLARDVMLYAQAQRDVLLLNRRYERQLR